MRGVILAGVALVVGVLPGAGAWAQSQWARFDGGVQTSPGVTVGFSRATAVVGYDGEPVPADTPRWHPPVLLCGPMGSLDLLSGKSISALGAGLDSDGQTPVWVIRNATNIRLTIHFGVGSVERAYLDDDWAGTYQLFHKDNDKGGISNLLVGQTGLNGGTPDQPSMAFQPSGIAAVHNGLIVLNCEVKEDLGNGYVSTRVALAYTTTARLKQADPWIVAALGEPTNLADHQRGAAWSMSHFPVGPDELIEVWTDYRAAAKTGGVCYATRFQRQGDEWTHETIRVARDDEKVLHRHFHAGGYIRHPDGRQTIVYSVGDSIGDNYLGASTLAPGGVWSSGEPVPGSGLDAGSAVYTPSPDWTTPQIVWGGVGEDPGLRHNQVITMRAADPQFSALLCGSDETDATVVRLAYDPDLRRPSWTVLGMPEITSWPGDGVIAFTFEGGPGGPYLTRIDAATNSDWGAPDDLETRVVYSPDGVLWGQCFVPMTTSSRPAVFVGDTAYIGAFVGDPVGLRRLTMPAWRRVRPLAVSPSADNLLRASIPIPTQSLDGGVQVTRMADPHSLPQGVPAPPCDGGNIFLIDNDGATGSLGRWDVVSDGADVPSPVSSVLVRAWLWALGPEQPGDPATTAQLAMQIFDQPGSRLNEKLNRVDLDSGQWCPMTLWVPATGFGAGTHWQPAVYLHTERASPVHAPNRMLIAWEGFYQDVPTVEGNGTRPSEPADDELATIRGMSLDGDWSLFLEGMVPYDQWDNRVGGTASDGSLTRSDARACLFSLEEASGKSLRLTADPKALGFSFALNDQGQTSVDVSDEVVWVRGSPVLALVRSMGGELVLDYSVGGSIPKRARLAGSITPELVRLGPDPMLWASVEAVPGALPDQAVGEVFQALGLRCRADFDRNGVVDTKDFIAFLNAWASGDSRADFNSDTMVDTLDFLSFLNQFASGC